jgi:hypothetical protein
MLKPPACRRFFLFKSRSIGRSWAFLNQSCARKRRENCQNQQIADHSRLCPELLRHCLSPYKPFLRAVRMAGAERQYLTTS